MQRYVDFLLPARGRRLGLWFAFGTALFTVLTSLGVALWAELVPAIVPNTTGEAATSGPWALLLLALEFAAVYGAVYLARRRGAPRWIWLPVAALGAWVSLASLVNYALSLIPAATQGVAGTGLGEVAASIFFGLSSLVSIALPAFLACVRTGTADEPLLGEFGEQALVFAGAGLVIVGVGLPQIAILQGWLSGLTGSPLVILGVPMSGSIILWAALVPGVACWLATSRFGLPRSCWLMVAAGGLWPVLSVLTPGTWVANVTAASSGLLAGVVFALLTTGGAILGAWAGTRDEAGPQPRPAT